MPLGNTVLCLLTDSPRLLRCKLNTRHAQLLLALCSWSSSLLAVCSASPTVLTLWWCCRHLLALEWFRWRSRSSASPCSHIGMSRRISRSKARPSRRTPSSFATAKLLLSLVGMADVRADHVCRNTFCLSSRGVLSSDLLIPLARITSAARAQSGRSAPKVR